MKTYKTVSQYILVICLLMFGANVFALQHLEEAIETEALRISLNDGNTGFVQGKICDDCKLLTVAITPETKAFERGTEVPLKAALDQIGRPATIFINLEHTKVIRISW